MGKLDWEMENVNQKHKVSVMQNELTSDFPMAVAEYPMEIAHSFIAGRKASQSTGWQKSESTSQTLIIKKQRAQDIIRSR